MKSFVRGGLIGFVIWAALVSIFFIFKFFGISFPLIIILSSMIATLFGFPIELSLNYLFGFFVIGIVFSSLGMLIGLISGKIKDRAPIKE